MARPSGPARGGSGRGGPAAAPGGARLANPGPRPARPGSVWAGGAPRAGLYYAHQGRAAAQRCAPPRTTPISRGRTLTTTRRILGWPAPSRRESAAALVLTGLACLLNLPAPLLVQRLVDRVVAGGRWG